MLASRVSSCGGFVYGGGGIAGGWECCVVVEVWWVPISWSRRSV